MILNSQQSKTGIPSAGLRRVQSAPRRNKDWTGSTLQVARILCVANQKGGVGKTTTSINLAAGLASSGHSTLLVDLDPQCNATTGLGSRPTQRHGLVVQQPLKDSIESLEWENLDLLPGSRSFQDIETLASGQQGSSSTLRRHFSGKMTPYDYVIIDCPPSLGHLTQTALSSSTEVLMPIQCEYFAMEGLTQMIETIRRVRNEQDSRLEFGGILLTMHDETLELTREVEAEVREFFGEIVYDVVVPRDVAVSEASSHGCSVLEYAPRARGSRAYLELCLEVSNL